MPLQNGARKSITREHQLTPTITVSNLILYAPTEQQQQGQFKLINSNHHVQTLENGSLAIRQTSHEHEGSYACEADNGVEPNLIKIIRLLVHRQAHFLEEISLLLGGVATSNGQQQQAAPTTAGGLKTVRLPQNSTSVRLLCSPHGDAPMQVDWLKDGRLLSTWSSGGGGGGQNNGGDNNVGQQSSARFHATTRWLQQRAHYESELVLYGQLARHDAGVYMCQARNSFGQADKRLHLVLQEPPEAPQLVDVAHVSSRSISLRWLAPFDGNSPIVKYVIEWRRQTTLGSADQQLEPVGRAEKLMPLAFAQLQQQQQLSAPAPTNSPTGQTIQHTVHELEPLTRYSMRIIAVNLLGQSRPSGALSLQTEEEGE